MQRGFTPIFILIAILVAGAIGGAYYLGTKKPTTPTPSSAQVATSQTPQLTSNPSDETANWKTYTDTTNSYTLKYPSDWKVGKCPLQPDCVPISTDTNIYIASSEKFGPEPEPIYYYLYIRPEVDLERNELISYKEETISGIKVFRTTDLFSRDGTDAVFFKKPNGGYILVGFSPYDKKSPFQEQERFYKVFNQILSTFKFTP